MFILLLSWMLTVHNCIDTKPMTPTSTTWSNQNIIDWPVMLCTLHEQKEVLWRTPTTWLHARPGMLRRPITSAKGEEWCGEATGLRTSLQTPGNTPRLQAKRNKKGWPGCSMCLISSPDDIFWWHLDVSYVSICQNSEEFIMPCVSSQAETDTASLGQACAPFEWFIYFVWWVQHSCPNQVVSWEFWKVMTVTNFNLVCPWFREILWGK